jgi:hypothetical protein
MTHDMEKIDRVWNKTMEYFTQEGWATHEFDSAIADRIYLRWLRQTHDVWELCGHRDSNSLRDTLEETFKQHYGEEGRSARLILFTLVLECRSRREGHVLRGRPAA